MSRPNAITLAAVAVFTLLHSDLRAADILAGERKTPLTFSDQFFVSPRGWDWVDSLFNLRERPDFGSSLDWDLGSRHGREGEWIMRDLADVWKAEHPGKAASFEYLYGHNGNGGFGTALMSAWLAGENSNTKLERSLIEQALKQLEREYSDFSGFAAPLRQEYERLRQENAGTDDRSWMKLYVKIHSLTNALSPLSETESIEKSIAALSALRGGDSQADSGELLSRLADLRKRGRSLAGQNSGAGIDQARAFASEFLAFRRALWTSGKRLGQYLALHESVDLRADWEDQLLHLQDDLGRREWFAKVASTTLRPESLIVDSDRDAADVVQRRTAALLDELRRTNGGKTDERLSAVESEFEALKQAASSLDPQLIDARNALYFEFCRIRRELAFINPLLDFKEILFVKRQFMPPAVNYPFFMSHGCYALGGGSLFVLEQPFSSKPVARNLLENATCESGRLLGKKLDHGAILSPNLSYDGKSLVFAFTEVPDARQKYVSQLDDAFLWAAYSWTPETCYHIFRMELDGHGLQQLTDGAYNDSDPCWLPNGRVAFVSDRRGGFPRSRWNYLPVQTLHAMNADGTGMARLSHHVNQEWQPCVSHDGNILYTRWDYWDRGYTSGFGCWTTSPDGCDPRAVSANYRGDKGAPGSEMNIRPVPDSNMLVATSSPNVFGGPYGPLIVFDPSSPDRKMEKDPRDIASFKRVTPELPLPYAEENRESGHVDYATAYPLSETFYLCVYDSNSNTYNGPRNNYGIYLIDAFGNKELLYRDPSISCLSPIPVRAQPVPPIIPETAHPPLDPVRETTKGKSDFGIAGVVNVYDSKLPFPKDATIKELRIWQIVPKSTPIKDRPQVRMGDNSGPRTCLGTVPVESDGSACFKLPANIPVFFQALDEHGCAVQSMRSDTYIQPGQTMMCTGCHEPKDQAAPRRNRAPLAFARPPSEIKPEPDGSNPFSYARLVQPVLERRCVACHTQNAEKGAPDLTRGDWKKDPDRFYHSARSLFPFLAASMQSYAAHLGQSDRTIPGEFGARASKLYQVLKAGHKGVQLSEEEQRALNVWMDSNGSVFGSDCDIERQAAGEVVIPDPEPVNDVNRDRNASISPLYWLQSPCLNMIRDAAGFENPITDAIEPGVGFQVEGTELGVLNFGRSAFFPKNAYLDLDHDLLLESAPVLWSSSKDNGAYILLYQQILNIGKQPGIPLKNIEPLRCTLKCKTSNWTVLNPGGELPMLVLLAGEGEDDFGLFCCLEWPGPGGYVRFENGVLSAGIPAAGLSVNPGEALVLPRIHLCTFRGGRAQAARSIQYYLSESPLFKQPSVSRSGTILPDNVRDFRMMARLDSADNVLESGLRYGRSEASSRVLHQWLGDVRLGRNEKDWTPETLKRVMHCMDEVSRAQHLLGEPAVNVLEENAASQGCSAVFYVSPSQEEAYLFLRGAQGVEKTLSLSLKGLTADAKYQVQRSGGWRAIPTATGAELAARGFNATFLPNELSVWQFKRIKK